MTEVAALPNYVSVNPNTGGEVPPVLRARAAEVSFPLNEADLADLTTLVAKYDAEGPRCAGLAAPQIGISKRFIVFATPDDADFRIWRPDLTDVMSKTVWLNPSYVGNETEGFHEDFEGCFSVEGVAGMVRRFKQINYTAYDKDGNQLVGVANGYLARLIQHEIDHLNGVLFTDNATNIIPTEEYRRMRDEAIQRGYR